MRLPAEAPRAGLAADERLLAEVTGTPADAGEAASTAPRVRWWTAISPALVVGPGLRQRVYDVVDRDRCRTAGVEILHRRAGGGALLLDDQMVCGTVCLPLPHPLVGNDITDSYRWLGELLAEVVGGRRVEVDEARADVTALRARSDPTAKLLLASCYGSLSPHEVAIGAAKVVGLAQVRTRLTALFQFGVLLRDQTPLADLLKVATDQTRQALRAELATRTAGVALKGQSAFAMAAAIEDAMPFER